MRSEKEAMQNELFFFLFVFSLFANLFFFFFGKTII